MTPQELAALDPDERKSFVRLSVAGYRIVDGLIYRTWNDPEPGEGLWEGVEIGPSSGSFAQDYEDLSAAGFPRHAEEIQCKECGEVDVPSLGDLCSACNQINIAQTRAGI